MGLCQAPACRRAFKLAALERLVAGENVSGVTWARLAVRRAVDLVAAAIRREPGGYSPSVRCCAASSMLIVPP